VSASFFDLEILIPALLLAVSFILLFFKLKALKAILWFILGIIVAYILFFSGLGEAIIEWLRGLLFGSLVVGVIGYEREERDVEPEDYLLTFGIGPVMIFAILAGVALMVGLPIFLGQVGGGTSEAIEAFGEAFGDAVREAVSIIGYIAIYIMPALIAILPLYVLRHKNKLSFLALGAIYGLLVTFILFQIGYVQVMVETFAGLYGSWAAVPATVTSTVLSGFILRMIDEWIAGLKRVRR